MAIILIIIIKWHITAVNLHQLISLFDCYDGYYIPHNLRFNISMVTIILIFYCTIRHNYNNNNNNNNNNKLYSPYGQNINYNYTYLQLTITLFVAKIDLGQAIL